MKGLVQMMAVRRDEVDEGHGRRHTNHLHSKTLEQSKYTKMSDICRVSQGKQDDHELEAAAPLQEQAFHVLEVPAELSCLFYKQHTRYGESSLCAPAFDSNTVRGHGPCT